MKTETTLLGSSSSFSSYLRFSRRRAFAAWVIAIGLVSAGCGAKMPEDVGVGPLAPCPDTPNCVSSAAPLSSDARVEPFKLVGSPEQAWAVALEVLAEWKRLEIVARSETAIHAEVKSALFRFEDDLELRLVAADGRVDVRSASRLGRSDLGANRKRVERLREALIKRGVVSSVDPSPSVEP